MAKVNSGQDKQAKALASGVIGFQGTATASSSTSLTATGTPFVASAYVGQLVVAANSGTGPTCYGVITANTTSVLTVDRWYNPNSPTGSAATTPSSTSQYVILPGNAPVFYMALTANATAVSNSDTALTAEIATAGGGLIRQAAAYAHTTGANTYTLTGTYTANGSDSLPVTIAKVGTFDAATQSAGGTMLHETLLSTTATLSAVGDQLTVTQTVTM